MNALQAVGSCLPGRMKPTDLRLEPGTLTALVGPNGSGKTSLLHALAGIGDSGGEVRIVGQRLPDISPAARPSRLGYVSASRELAWPMTVRAVVTLTARHTATAAVDALLDDMDLTLLASRRADRLSTGERTRVLIARALLPQPSVLLLDEPFANLDPLWQLRLADRLRETATRGAAILFSAHDLDLAARLAQRMLVIDAGACVADGTPSTLEADGTIARVFGVARSDTGWRAA